jgi:hypothetical protein
MADVTIAGVALGAIGRGSTLDAAKIGLTAAIEATQSGSTIETRRTTGDVARRCARGATGRKGGGRSGQRTTNGRTTGTGARRMTGEHRRRTRRRAELRQSSIGRRDGGTEQHARG